MGNIDSVCRPADRVHHDLETGSCLCWPLLHLLSRDRSHDNCSAGSYSGMYYAINSAPWIQGIHPDSRLFVERSYKELFGDVAGVVKRLNTCSITMGRRSHQHAIGQRDHD